MSVSLKKLWQVQLEEFPNSVRLCIHDVYRWCDSGLSLKTINYRYRQISLALQYRNHVFYRIDGTSYMGFRFGTHGSEYMSLYSSELD